MRKKREKEERTEQIQVGIRPLTKGNDSWSWTHFGILLRKSVVILEVCGLESTSMKFQGWMGGTLVSRLPGISIIMFCEDMFASEILVPQMFYTCTWTFCRHAGVGHQTFMVITSSICECMLDLPSFLAYNHAKRVDLLVRHQTLVT